jgi:threonine dehydrogenase-like Zn-dependent dehydrogenase
MPETMRGVVQTGERAVSVVEVPRPELEPGTALVRVRAAGICGSDLHPFRHRKERRSDPEGHEVAGEVVAVAPRPGEPALVREGDLVALDTICLGKACGDCRWCAEGAFFHCENKRRGPGWSGAFADYIKRDVRGLFPLPAPLSAEDGALVEPLAVGVHGVRLAQLRRGETVAIVGAGTIGLTSLIAARALGTGAIYALARHPHQLELARALGATEVVTGSPEEATERVRSLTGGLGADLVIETVGGAPDTFDQSCALVRRRGRIAVLGLFDKPSSVDLGRPLGKEATIVFPVCYGTIDGRHDYDVAIDLIRAGMGGQDGSAPVSRLLTHRFPLGDAQRAFDTAVDKTSGAVKVQLIP